MVGTKIEDRYEVSIFIGSKNESTGKFFTREDLIKEIANFQNDCPDRFFPVRVTDTTYVSGKEYSEDGWQITAIQYPRAPAKECQIRRFMSDMAQTLLLTFSQNRICVMDETKVVQMERSY
jgi:hypothetical protein